MGKKVKIGSKLVGDGEPCFVIAEIGINHNGSVEIAKKLIDISVSSGCDAVKFQKRTVDVVYTQEELAMPRPNPFGDTNGDLKRGLEFTYEDYLEIDDYCRFKGIMWFASCWDEGAIDFIDMFDPPCYKIASASLTDDNLLRYTRSKGKPILLSTGMSTQEEIDHAIEVLGKNDLILYHCTSTYPTDSDEINLSVITDYRKNYDFSIGFSGHERGITPSIIAVALGAVSIERHVTLDRTMWGSDQAASLEPEGLFRLVRDIRQVPALMGDGCKVVYDSEKPIIKKLRRVNNSLNVIKI
ncbi:MAG: N-acetylneuraminate synthase [Candidatus Melainabacteria bacterium RIFOXYA12_FULL_32_12]|nr:MAG: N-acetylneuraminate synthase [Candidatus Melainabacteria bacterium RIFOXYA2_FULL_32_9]OGI24792.1 MAG: N-acetylneuraminate synthase [Candidatus Melainabacteria bacterium RIFOXYA12_FULL_32_12]